MEPKMNLFENLETLNEKIKQQATRIESPTQKIEPEPKVDNIELEEHRQNPPSSDKNNDSSPLIPFARLLTERGVLAADALGDEYDGSIDGLISAVENTINKYNTQVLDTLTPEAREFVQLLNEGVDLDRAREIVSVATDVSKINREDVLEDPIIAEKITRMYLERTGLPADEIEDQIELLKDTDRLNMKADTLLNKLKQDIEREKTSEIEKSKQLKAKYEQENKQILDTLKKQINETEEIIPGVKLAKSIKDKIYNNLTTPVEYDANGNPVNKIQSLRSKDPMKFEIVLNYLAELGVFEGKWDSVTNGGKTKTVQELEEALRKSSDFGAKGKIATERDLMDASKASEIIKQIPSSLDFLFQTKK
jgi:hypothetical protein